MSRSRHQAGFSLLEAMLAVLVLMSGIVGIAQLSASMRRSLAPDDGMLQHPEITELLMRDAVEAARNSNSPVPPGNTAKPLGDATYSVIVQRLHTQSAQGFTIEHYALEVQDSGGKVLGRTRFDKVISPAGVKGGL